MTYSTQHDGRTFDDVAQLAHATTEALATLDAQRLEMLSEAAEELRGEQQEQRSQQAAPGPSPASGTAATQMISRVSQAAAHEVTALRELMRFTSDRLSLIETMHRQHRGDASGWKQDGSRGWAR